MKFFKSRLSRFSRKSTHVVATNMEVGLWWHQLRMQPAQFVKKIEMCTAAAAGDDAWGIRVGKTHLHTLLRVFSTDTDNIASEHVLLIERVLSTGYGAHHSVAPIPEPLSNGGSLFHPEVHDRVCVITDGPSTKVARDLEVERTITFGDGSSAPRITLDELGQIIQFLSRSTKVVCAGGDCKYQSRSFAFTCMAALSIPLPPCTLVRKTGERVDINASQHGADVVNDSMFELAAVTFLGQARWLFKDQFSVQALRLIEYLKKQPRTAAPARLYH